MATGIIKGNNVSTGTITKKVSTGTLDMTMCRRVGNVINVAGRIHGMSNQLANGYFFSIPEGFRPRSGETILATACVVTNNSSLPVVLTGMTIYDDGDVGLSYSSAWQVTQIQFFATYAV